MPYPRNEKRNKELVKLRKADPVKWSYSQLAGKFKISRPMVLKLWKKYQNEY